MEDFGNPEAIKTPLVRIATGEQILTAQRLHAWRYLEEGYVKKSDITEEGVLSDLIDPYKPLSTYFILSDEHTPRQPVVVARQIEFDPNNVFPVLKNMTLWPSGEKAVDKVDHPRCVEISGLAKVPNARRSLTLMLYRDMWHFSLKESHDKWFIASDIRLTEDLKAMFNGAIQSIGPTQDYLGSPTDPMLLDASHGMTTLLEECLDLYPEQPIDRKEIVALLLEGLDLEFLSEKDRLLIQKLFP